VNQLLDAKAHVDPVDAKGMTPLLWCSRRREEGAVRGQDAAKVACALLDRKAKLEQRDSERGLTPLLYASSWGSASVVEVLLAHKADTKAVSERGSNALILAARNHHNGMDIIPMLGALVDPSVRNNDGLSAMAMAVVSGNAATVKALVPFYKPGQGAVGYRPGPLNADPVGSIREAVVSGCAPKADWFGKTLNKAPATHSWALLRVSGVSIESVFGEMERGCRDAALWRLVGLELLTTRHPTSGDTLLHVAARSNNMVAVRELIAIYMNPLLLNNADHRAVALATDADVRRVLLNYAEFQPRREVVRWYGPLLRDRARTFLLVALRWRATQLRCLPKDVEYLIIQRVAAVEYV
jgi:ankyrin repeat protein